MRQYGNQCFYFQIRLFIFPDTVILKIYFLMTKKYIFRGDLSGISAKKSSLMVTVSSETSIESSDENVNVHQEFSSKPCNLAP